MIIPVGGLASLNPLSGCSLQLGGRILREKGCGSGSFEQVWADQPSDSLRSMGSVEVEMA